MKGKFSPVVGKGEGGRADAPGPAGDGQACDFGEVGALMEQHLISCDGSQVVLVRTDCDGIERDAGRDSGGKGPVRRGKALESLPSADPEAGAVAAESKAQSETRILDGAVEGAGGERPDFDSGLCVASRGDPAVVGADRGGVGDGWARRIVLTGSTLTTSTRSSPGCGASAVSTSHGPSRLPATRSGPESNAPGGCGEKRFHPSGAGAMLTRRRARFHPIIHSDVPPEKRAVIHSSPALGNAEITRPCRSDQTRHDRSSTAEIIVASFENEMLHSKFSERGSSAPGARKRTARGQ